MKSTLIFVTSDIHGSEEVLEDLLDRATKLGAGRFLIAGDLCPKGPAIPILLQNAPFAVAAVKGNCDWLWDFKDAGLPVPKECLYLVLDNERHIGMTHGDRITDAVEFPFPLVANDIFIQGHTHVPELYRDGDGIIHLNPGSPSRPRSGYGATYAIISDEKIEVRKLKNDKTIFSEKLT